MARREHFRLEPPPAPHARAAKAQRARISRGARRAVRDIGHVPLQYARWPGNFVAAVEVGAAALRELDPSASDDARAMAMILAVARWLGPGRHYWPNAEELHTAARDWRIYNREFDGRNAHALAAKYRMTVRGMLKLLKRQREFQLAARRSRANT